MWGRMFSTFEFRQSFSRDRFLVIRRISSVPISSIGINGLALALFLLRRFFFLDFFIALAGNRADARSPLDTSIIRAGQRVLRSHFAALLLFGNST